MTLPREAPRDRVNATLGMIFFVGSWTMAFGTLYLSFLVLRERTGTWPPPGIALPSFPMACVATGVLFASSVLLHLAMKRCRRDGRGFTALWSAGLVTALAFAAIQTWLWFDLWAAGRTPESGLYESLFYGLTWVHGAHVAAGLVALLWVLGGAATGRYGPHKTSTAGNVAIFWHFVDVVWIALFLGFFVF